MQLDETIDELGNNALTRAIIKEESFEYIARLLKGGLNPNHRNRDGNTPCMFVVLCWRGDLAQLFLEYGGNFYERNNDSLFPVEVCESTGNVDMLGDIVDQRMEDIVASEIETYS